MNLIPQSVTRAVSRQSLVVKKHSPHILFAGGVIGVIGSCILACRATLQLEETADEIREDLANVKLQFNETAGLERERSKALVREYVKGTVKIGRLYGPSVLVGTASLAALTGSHVQMTRRNSALTATLVAVSNAYEDYRRRVQEEIGAEKELDIYRGVKEIKNGKEILRVVDPNGLSPFARCFDETSAYWRPESELNFFFIKCQQIYANDKLKAKGHIFLNEVYDSLGFERTPEGQIVGWVVNRDGSSDGAGYVDFGMFEERNQDFYEWKEPSVWLDFNVDGVVFEKI